MESKTIEEKVEQAKQKSPSLGDRLSKLLELAGSAYSLYKTMLPYEKRDLIQTVSSNRYAEGKNLTVMLSLPFAEVAKRSQSGGGCTTQTTGLIWDALLDRLPGLLIEHQASHSFT